MGTESGKILVVDADPRRRKALARPLTKAGYEVIEHEAAHGIEQRLFLAQPALVLLESSFAEAGLEACRQWQKEAAAPDLPVVLHGEAFPLGLDPTKEKDGLSAFLQYPVADDQLLDVCRQLLMHSNAEPPGFSLEGGDDIDAALTMLDPFGAGESAPQPTAQRGTESTGAQPADASGSTEAASRPEPEPPAARPVVRKSYEQDLDDQLESLFGAGPVASSCTPETSSASAAPDPVTASGDSVLVTKDPDEEASRAEAPAETAAPAPVGSETRVSTPTVETLGIEASLVEPSIDPIAADPQRAPSRGGRSVGFLYAASVVIVLGLGAGAIWVLFGPAPSAADSPGEASAAAAGASGSLPSIARSTGFSGSDPARAPAPATGLGEAVSAPAVADTPATEPSVTGTEEPCDGEADPGAESSTCGPEANLPENSPPEEPATETVAAVTTVAAADDRTAASVTAASDLPGRQPRPEPDPPVPPRDPQTAPDFEPPTIRNRAQPLYLPSSVPPEGLEVVLRVFVNERGFATRIEIEQGRPGTQLVQAATEATLLSSWQPARAWGKPAATWIQESFRFER